MLKIDPLDELIAFVRETNTVRTQQAVLPL